jgi:hypothetical protein
MAASKKKSPVKKKDNSGNKTVKNRGSVKSFLATLPDAQMRADSEVLVKLMEDITGSPAAMWGTAIIGFGERTITSAAGRVVDWFQVGFSPRKAALTLYLSIGEGYPEALLRKLGKHSGGKGCLYIKRLSDVDASTLRALITLCAKRARG